MQIKMSNIYEVHPKKTFNIISHNLQENEEALNKLSAKIDEMGEENTFEGFKTCLALSNFFLMDR